MLVMLDKAQRYGNKADFHTNSGLTEEDYDLTERAEANGLIDDRNASDYLEEANKQKEERMKRLNDWKKWARNRKLHRKKRNKKTRRYW